MKELLYILYAYRRSVEPMALATVVETAGSSYRRPGARMLIFENGTTIGCLSGGCLDQDLVLHAAEVIERQQAVLVDYNTADKKADVLFGTSTGCNGAIHVLIEPVNPRSSRAGECDGILGFIDDLVTKRKKGVAVTVIRTPGEMELNPGNKILLEEGCCIPKRVEGNWSSDLIGKVEHCLTDGSRGLVSIETERGIMRIFCESLQPPPTLVIFGAGQDAMPLVRLAKEIGFRVELFDWRPAYLANNCFALADATYADRPEAILRHVSLDTKTAVVIMSHNFLADLECLKQLISANILI